jgi:hypothetical protein
LAEQGQQESIEVVQLLWELDERKQPLESSAGGRRCSASSVDLRRGVLDRAKQRPQVEEFARGGGHGPSGHRFGVLLPPDDQLVDGWRGNSPTCVLGEVGGDLPDHVVQR